MGQEAVDLVGDETEVEVEELRSRGGVVVDGIRGGGGKGLAAWMVRGNGLCGLELGFASIERVRLTRSVSEIRRVSLWIYIVIYGGFRTWDE